MGKARSAAAGTSTHGSKATQEGPCLEEVALAVPACSAAHEPQGTRGSDGHTCRLWPLEQAARQVEVAAAYTFSLYS